MLLDFQTVRMPALPNFTCRVSAFPTKIPVITFIEKGKKEKKNPNLKVNMKQKAAGSQSYLSRRGITGSKNMLDLKLYHSHINKDSGPGLKPDMRTSGAKWGNQKKNPI